MLLVDDGQPSARVREAFEARAATDSSGLVLTFLASALGRFAHADRWTLAEALARRGALADDRVFPLMLWYGVEPAVVEQPRQAVALVEATRISKLRRFVTRRLTGEIERQPQAVAQLAQLLARPAASDARLDILSGMSASLRGWRKATPPAGWDDISRTLARDRSAHVRREARALSLVFGDGRAMNELRRIAEGKSGDLDARRAAIRALVAARAEGLPKLLQGLLGHRELSADAARGLAAYNHPQTPQLLIAAFDRFRQPAREEAISVLVSRAAYARQLLAGVADGKIDRQHVSAFQLRQLQLFSDDEINRRIAELWPELQEISAQKVNKIVEYREQLTAERLAAADAAAGRVLFERTCAKCHKLFGEGGNVAPDLSGAQRNNLNYLLENIVDPSATVSKNYNMSTVITLDARIINGVINQQSERTITIQTPTERLVLRRDEIEEIRKSNLSMMPEGLLDVLEADQVRDLIAYLMSPRQVPLPE